MKLNTIKTKCKYCGKEFLKSTKNKNHKLPLGVLDKRRVTCSSECSKKYARKRRKEEQTRRRKKRNNEGY